MAFDQDLLRAATKLLVTTQYGSITMLHRKMQVSVAQAWEIMDRLEKLGIVAPFNGVEIRVVIAPADDVDRTLNAVTDGRPYVPVPTDAQTAAAVAVVRQQLPVADDGVARRIVEALADEGWRPPIKQAALST
jgi:S-DNA-T family DNA segregation ATPase FtsK/SpoIIIE